MANDNNIAQLIVEMRQADFYPHNVVENIQLVQTHASYVFLTGKYVYKVKKSVNYGFLDYSTLAKRKYFLETELRLNQQIAQSFIYKLLRLANRIID